MQMDVVLAALASCGWEVFSCDHDALARCQRIGEAQIRVSHPEHGRARLLFIWQEPLDDFDHGFAVLSDYSTRLEHVLEDVYADALA